MADTYDIRGHKRPLPPPQSRQAVLLQIRNTDTWAVVDEAEELQILLPRKRYKFDHAATNRASAYPNEPFRPVTQHSHVQQFKRRDSVEVFEPRDRYLSPKKRLFNSSAYLHRVQEENETMRKFATKRTSGSDNINNSTCVGRDAEAFANRGGKTFDIRGPVALTNSEDAEEEALRLARATRDELPDMNESPVPLRAIDTQAPVQERSRNDIARERLEQAGQARSRELRQRNLTRRLGGGQKNEPNSSSEAEQVFDSRVDPGSLSDEHSSPPSSVLNNEQYVLSDQNAEELSNSQLVATPDVDQLFEVAKQAAERYATQWLQEPECSYATNTSSMPLHPASRAAADRFRTQNRHITSDHQQPNSGMFQPRDHITGEARLRILTSQTFESASVTQLRPQGRAPEFPRPASTPTVLFSPKALAKPITIASNVIDPDLINGTEVENSRPIPTRPLQSSSEAMTVLIPLEKLPIRSQPLSTSSPPQQQRINFEIERTGRRSDSTQTSSFNPEQYPSTPSITVPKSFDKYDQERQAIIREAEFCKERERDLSAIIPTFEQIAQLGTLDQFSETERKEIIEVQDYVRAVIDHSLSGKIMRHRINHIRSNMTRRIQRCSPGDAADSQGLLDTLIKCERRQHITQLISEARARLAVLRSKRSGIVSKFHSKKAKKHNQTKSNEANEGQKEKQVRFASNPMLDSSDPFSNLPDGTAIELPNLLEPPQQKLTATERRRAAQYAAHDRKEASLRASLAMFSAGDPVTNINALVDTGDTEDIVSNEDNISEISEEQDGAELFSYHPFLPELTPNDLSALDDLEPIQMSPHKDDALPLPRESNEERPVSSQAQHDELATSIHQRYKQRGILGQQKVQRSDYELINSNKEEANGRPTSSPADESASEPEFDDLDTSSSEEEQSNKDRMCYRYVVTVCSNNMVKYESGVDHLLGRFLSSEKARATVEQFKEECKNDYKQSLDPGTNPVIREEYSGVEGYDEHKLSFGCDGESACRIVIEKKCHNPSQEAYQHAKVSRACNARPVYTVRWERTTTYTPVQPGVVENMSQSQNSAELEGWGSTPLAHNSSNNNNVDDNNTDPNKNTGADDVNSNTDNHSLFGSDTLDTSEPKSAVLSTYETTVISIDALRCFSNIAQANRHAADVFMQWWMENFPGRENYHSVRWEDQAMEEHLRRIGNQTKFLREENFDTRIYNDGDGDEEGQQQEKTLETIRNDKIKVWVVKNPVVGPSN